MSALSLIFVIVPMAEVAAQFQLNRNPNTFNVDFSNLTGLTCFQCNSFRNAQNLVCDSDDFISTSKRTKIDLLIQCQLGRQYCAKVVKRSRSDKNTIRGCFGNSSLPSGLVRAGCHINKKEIVCLCKENLCNKASILAFRRTIVLLFSFFNIHINY